MKSLPLVFSLLALFAFAINTAADETEIVGALFAVEITTGPALDDALPAHEQPGFTEHSANLKRLREDGALLMGARYSDIGLLVIRADDMAAVEAMMAADPTIDSGVFQYEAHPMNVFYEGAIER